MTDTLSPPSPERAPTAGSRAEGAVPLDERHDRELRGLLADRLVAESPLSELVHVLLAAGAALLARPWVPGTQVVLWILAVAAAALLRGILRRRAVRRGAGPERLARSVRVGVLLLGVAWGAGVVLIGPRLPPGSLAWVTVLFAGLVAGGTLSLLADPPSFYILLCTLLGGLATAVALGGLGAPDVVGLSLVLLYGAAMVAFYRRSHHAVVAQLRTAKALELSERAAGRERALLDSLVAGAPSAIAVTARDGTVVRVNRSFEALFGYPAVEAVGRSLHALVVPPDEAGSARELDARVWAGETVVIEARRRRRDGTPLVVRLAAAPVTTEGTEVAFILCDDVTEARETRLASERLARIVEATTDPVAVAGPDGALRYLNAAGRELLGIGPDEDSAGLALTDLLPPRLRDAFSLEHFPEAMEEGHWVGEGALLHRDGREIPVSLVALAHRTGAGAVESVSLVARDLTREVSAREALRASRDAAEQAAATRSSFLATTSHEVRTPLNGILGMVELLLDTELTPSQRRSAELIAASAESLLGIVDNLLDLSKIEAAQLELEDIPFDLHDAIGSAVRLLTPRAHAQGIELVADVGLEVPRWVSGDPHRLRQVLVNLTANAVKFTHAGEVVVSARLVGETGGRARLRFGVRDTGIGIAAEHLERIFEPFRQADASTTRKYGGTGLGLAIARRLVAMMGGDIEVESEPSRGSAFHFEVALSRAAAASPDAGSEVLPLGDGVRGLARPDLFTGPGVEQGRRSLRVLLVEDDPVSQEIAASMLRRRGHDVRVVGTGQEAVEAVRRDGRFDVVLMDLQLPDLDGLEATALIRRLEGGRMPIIALTANVSAAEERRCLAAGVNGYVSKPFRSHQLFAAVDGWAARGEEVPAAAAPIPRRPDAVDLGALRAALGGTDAEDTAREVLALFLRDTPGRLDALEAAARKGDEREVERGAHALRSAAAAVRAVVLASLLRRVEEAARGHDRDAVAPLLTSIRAEHRRVVEFVEAYLGSGG